jgi:hypothetical protein
MIPAFVCCGIACEACADHSLQRSSLILLSYSLQFFLQIFQRIHYKRIVVPEFFVLRNKQLWVLPKKKVYAFDTLCVRKCDKQNKKINQSKIMIKIVPVLNNFSSVKIFPFAVVVCYNNCSPYILKYKP